MSSTPPPVGVALCGASGIAPAHARAIQRSPGARLIRVYSRDRDRARALGEAVGCEWTADYDAVLDDSRVGAVDIVTEPSRHAALALQAIARGKHVLVEKPIDDGLDGAARLVAASAASPVVVSVVSPRRFDTALQALRARLHAGAIGSARMAIATMLLHRDRAYYERAPGWRRDGSHVLLNQGIHWLDALIWLFGFPEAVTATTSTLRAFTGSFDTAIVSSRHAHGVLSVLTASTACEGARVDSLSVVGDRGRLEYDAGEGSGRLGRFAAKWTGARHDRDPLRAQLADFVDSIQAGRPPAVTAADGYAALRFVKLCEQTCSTPG